MLNCLLLSFDFEVKVFFNSEVLFKRKFDR